MSIKSAISGWHHTSPEQYFRKQLSNISTELRKRHESQPYYRILHLAKLLRKKKDKSLSLEDWNVSLEI